MRSVKMSWAGIMRRLLKFFKVAANPSIGQELKAAEPLEIPEEVDPITSSSRILLSKMSWRVIKDPKKSTNDGKPQGD